MARQCWWVAVVSKNCAAINREEAKDLDEYELLQPRGVCR